MDQTAAEADRREPAYSFVRVERRREVDIRRIKLPACMMEQEIVDAVRSNDVVMITGDTGCGKSTQVPQFLYENGFCIDSTIIGVTQVRRVACLALYQQVALELNSETLVGYQFRFNKGYNYRKCKIKFMTDGTLLQEIKQDMMCSRYSVLIIDEAHDRNLNCDLLIGILSRVVKARREIYNAKRTSLPPLKLIIMSATIRAEEFLGSRIFEGAICHRHISTQFKRNTIHFARRSVTDYVSDAYDKIIKIHKRLPPGSILVFLTGKDELTRLKNMLKPYGRKSGNIDYGGNEHIKDVADDDKIFDIESENECDSTLSSISDDEERAQELSRDTCFRGKRDREENDTESNSVSFNSEFKKESHSGRTLSLSPISSLEDEPVVYNRNVVNENPSSSSSSSVRSASPNGEQGKPMSVMVSCGRILTNPELQEEHPEDKEYQVELDVLSKTYKRLSDIKWLGAGSGCGVLRVVVMHASQTMDTQMAAFRAPRSDERVVILSTNVAETAVTLPNIRYVIDCGKEKRRLDDITKGVSRFAICDISKASADQRAGRAGRVGTGHCYRQYTSSVYETLFNDYAPVEIENCNMESTILFLSSIGIERPFEFPFLTRPPIDNIKAAMHALAIMGAIDIPNQGERISHSIQHELSTKPFKIEPAYPYKSKFELIQDLKVAKVTKLGQYLSLLPIQPRYAKMIYCVLSKGIDAEVLRLACAVITAFAVGAGNIMLPTYGNDTPTRKKLPKLTSDFELFIWVCCRFSRLNKEGASIFCHEYGISEKMMNEVFQQAKQLYDILRTSLSDNPPSQVNWNAPIKPPDHNVARHIEDSIVECMVDKVAVLSSSLPGSFPRKTGAYSTASLLSSMKDVWLSRTYMKHRPEFVVYGSLIGDEKLRMQDVALTDAATLSRLKSPLILPDKFQKTPIPQYDHTRDCVMAYVRRQYAPLQLTVGITRAPVPPEHPLATRVFAKELCFGGIFPGLSAFVSSLTVTPGEFMGEIKYTSPLGQMLAALRRAHVSSRAAFVEHRKQQPKFLISEYRNLLRRDSFEQEVLERIFTHLTES
ncbi:ATP-dependent RNA helicase [Babesia gibsoni]|uniref:RNA helicase n=1 Tax=Babesia gibsoni TaxID=33632 RepID=A0AAD8LII7_BABGI|nr:ATP-dependent RNA helicase [Babesia gibsoni]